MASQRYQCLHSQNQRDFTNVINVKELEMERLSWIIHKGKMTTEEGKERCSSSGFEEGKGSHRPVNVSTSISWKREGNIFSMEPPVRNVALLTPWF